MVLEIALTEESFVQDLELIIYDLKCVRHASVNFRVGQRVQESRKAFDSCGGGEIGILSAYALVSSRYPLQEQENLMSTGVVRRVFGNIEEVFEVHSEVLTALNANGGKATDMQIGSAYGEVTAHATPLTGREASGEANGRADQLVVGF